MRCLKTLLSLFALVVWPCVAAADGPPPQFPVKEIRTTPDSYVGPEGKTELPLVLSHIGAYLPEGRKQQRTLTGLAGNFELKVDRVYQDQLAFLRLPDQIEDREKLISLVRELRAKAEGSGIKFGLAYHDGRSDAVPSISTDEVIVGLHKGEAMEELVAEMKERGYALLALHPYLKAHAVFTAPDRDDVDLIYVNDNYGDFTASPGDLVDDALNGQRPDLVRPVAPSKKSRFLTKVRHSAFYATPLDYLLGRLKTECVVLTGQVTEQCILYTALDAYIRHLEVIVPEDAVAHIYDDLGDAALQMMRRNMGARLVTTEDCLT